MILMSSKSYNPLSSTSKFELGFCARLFGVVGEVYPINVFVLRYVVAIGGVWY